MKVELDISDNTLVLGNNGIELVVRDAKGTHLGVLRIGRARVSWTKSKAKTKADGIKLEEMIAFVETSQEAQAPPKKAATRPAAKSGPRGRSR